MKILDTEKILERREYFPRGLAQPEGGYRFSLDSLLLASFGRPGRRQKGIDLGAGCGVVALAMLLQHPDLKMWAVEIDEESVVVAQENAQRLHLSDKLTIVGGDVAQWRPEKVVDFVVSNPPYRTLNTGRVSRGEGRGAARFESKGNFAAFARCAALSLKTRGKFSFVHLPERLAEIMHGLQCAKLEPKRMRFVHGRKDEPAKMVLIEAMKAGGVGLKLESPLFLHEGIGKETRLTRQVLDFCPFLACNKGE